MSLIKEILSFAAGNGYRAFSVKGHDTFGYIITPADNVISVSKGEFGGVIFCFDYVPSKKNGSGCLCNDKALYVVPSITELQVIEAVGKDFATKLGAEFYKNSSQWYKKNYWQQHGLLREVA